MGQPTAAARVEQRLFGDIRTLIEAARLRAAKTVNAGLVTLYWSIGRRVGKELLGGKRAAYGERIVSTLSRQLAAEYGRGFSKQSLFRMIRFAELFPDPKIVSTLLTQLGWSHFLELIPLKDPLQREFYAEMARLERWSVRTLQKKIGGMLYERTALSKKPRELAALELRKLREDDRLSADLIFQDPYLLDMLGLKGAYQEKDIEAAILREMEAFILELGSGFAFVARQKRIQIGPTDFYLDLLFFNRKLRRLVAVELKLGRFKPEDKGQMELYLRWLDRHERSAGEGPPLGLILCAEKSEEQIELLRLDESGIRVAEYLTELPARAALEKRLRAAIAGARARLARGR